MKLSQKTKEIITGLILSGLCIIGGFLMAFYIMKPEVYMTTGMMLENTEYYRDESGSGYVESCITKTCILFDNCCSLAYFTRGTQIIYWCNGFYENGECVIEDLGYSTLGTEDILVSEFDTNVVNL